MNIEPAALDAGNYQAQMETSKAISLKRIADALETISKGNSEQVANFVIDVMKRVNQSGMLDD